MEASINMTAVMTASTLGIMLSASLLSVIGWRRNSYTSENKTIVHMIFAILMANIADPIAFYADGHTEMIYIIIIRIADFIVYFSNITICLLWWIVISEFINVKVNKYAKYFIGLICVISTALLIINLFIPIIYYFDENNVYHRLPLSVFYTIVQLIFALGGITYYLIAKRKGGILKLVPIWQFVLPVLIGILLQRKFYGISLIIPSCAVGVFGLVLGMRNTQLFGDQLTGVYNRYYLDYIKRKTDHRKSSIFTIMMLDLNNFKFINDSFGHAEGDEALITTANILSDEVGTLGSVIRYAGDEFVVVLNTSNEEVGSSVQSRIKESFRKYNETSNKGYIISAAFGRCIADLKKRTVDDVMNEVDKYMYEDKKLKDKTNY